MLKGVLACNLLQFKGSVKGSVLTCNLLQFKGSVKGSVLTYILLQFKGIVKGSVLTCNLFQFKGSVKGSVLTWNLLQFKGSVRRKYSIVIVTKLTSICCVNKEKIVINDSYRRTLHPYKFWKLQYSALIVKNQFNSKQIIQLLQPLIADCFSTHSYIVDIS